MKPGKPWWSVIGLIIWESIALVDLGIDLYTGETTGTEFAFTLVLCLLIAIFMYYLIRKWIRKNRGQ